MICIANQLTSFYRWGTLVVNGLKLSQNSEENTYGLSLFQMSFMFTFHNFIKKKTQAQVFFCEF